MVDKDENKQVLEDEVLESNADDVMDDEEMLPEEEEQSIEELKAKIAQLKIDKDKIYNQYLHSEADAQNVRRRAEIDVSNAHKFALDGFIKALLPVIDALELEIEAVKGDSEELQQFKEGSELTYKMLLDACKKFGVVQLHPEGEKLNPEFHQAVTMKKHRDFESNTVIQVVQNGYMLNDRLIRAAQVIVAE